MAASPPSDLAFGAFSEHGPWTIDPERLRWRTDIDERRAAAQAEVPALVRQRRRSGSMVHGPCSLKAPKARSDEGLAATRETYRAGLRAANVCDCGRLAPRAHAC